MSNVKISPRFRTKIPQNPLVLLAIANATILILAWTAYFCFRS